MLRTEPAEFLVHRMQTTYLWLEVLHGGDQGLRVSVPLRHSTYSRELQEKMCSLTEGDVITAVLVSEDKERPKWRVEGLLPSEDVQLDYPLSATGK